MTDDIKMGAALSAAMFATWLWVSAMIDVYYAVAV